MGGLWWVGRRAGGFGGGGRGIVVAAPVSVCSGVVFVRTLWAGGLCSGRALGVRDEDV